jgi:hypothetical protein
LHRGGDDFRLAGGGDTERTPLRRLQIGAQRERPRQTIAVAFLRRDVLPELISGGEASQQA